LLHSTTAAAAAAATTTTAGLLATIAGLFLLLLGQKGQASDDAALIVTMGNGQIQNLGEDLFSERHARSEFQLSHNSKPLSIITMVESQAANTHTTKRGN